MYFYESVEFETRQKTTKGLNKPNSQKFLKNFDELKLRENL